MICLGDCLCLRGSPTRCEVTISEDVSATPTDDVTSRSFSVVDSSGVSGIPETRMSDRRPYCSSSSNCRRRFSFSWRKRLTSARIGSTICWIKSWTSSLIEALTDALTTSAIFCRSSLDSVRGWGLTKY